MKHTLILLIGLLLTPGFAFGNAIEQRRPINLDVTDFEFRRLAQNFAHMADAELEAPEELLEKTVTLRVDGVRWQTALDAICDPIGCSWQIKKGSQNLLVISETRDPRWGPPPPVSGNVDLNFRLETAREALRVVGSFGDFTTDIDPKISGFVTMRVRGVQLATALNIVCEKTGCYWLLEDGQLVIRKSEGLRADWPARLGEPVTMSLKNADSCEVLGAFERVTGTKVQCPSFVEGIPVTVEAHGLPADAVLHSLADSWNARWHYEDGQIHFTEIGEELSEKVDLDLIDANACDVVKALANMTGLTTMCTTFLQPKAISVNVKQIEVRDLLDQLCADWNCTWNMTNGGLFVEARND